MSAGLYLEAAKTFMCGQVVSVFSLLALVMAKRLVYRDVNMPMLLNMCFYFFLAVVYIVCRWDKPTTPAVGRATVKWWFYPILALIDLQANVCATKSLEYTSFATTGLTLNLAVPFVFALSVCVFGASYKWKHCVGCLATLAGGIVLLVGCYHRQTSHALGSENEVYGWSLAVIAAALYAGSNVINQWCMQIRGLDGTIECLGKVGAWGTLLCMLQVLVLERTEVMGVQWSAQVLLLVVGYVISMFAFYTAVFVLVEATETTLYNLSLLFSSVYLMLMAHHALDESLDVYTWAGMLAMFVGLGIYTWTRATVDGANGANGGLPQISFKSVRTPRQPVPNKLQLVEV